MVNGITAEVPSVRVNELTVVVADVFGKASIPSISSSIHPVKHTNVNASKDDFKLVFIMFFILKILKFYYCLM